MITSLSLGNLPSGLPRVRVLSPVSNRPEAIIRTLDLRRPIYRQMAAYGHFGRDDLDLPWEKTDKAKILKKEALGKG